MTALALAGHQQMAQNAFEAAESGIVAALLEAAEVREGGTDAATILADIATARAAYRTETREALGAGALPTGFSVGENAGTFAARTTSSRRTRNPAAARERGSSRASIWSCLPHDAASRQPPGGTSRNRRGGELGSQQSRGYRMKPGCIAPPCHPAQGPCSQLSWTARPRPRDSSPRRKTTTRPATTLRPCRLISDAILRRPTSGADRDPRPTARARRRRDPAGQCG
jgi:hypothetical protein